MEPAHRSRFSLPDRSRNASRAADAGCARRNSVADRWPIWYKRDWLRRSFLCVPALSRCRKHPAAGHGNRPASHVERIGEKGPDAASFDACLPGWGVGCAVTRRIPLGVCPLPEGDRSSLRTFCNEAPNRSCRMGSGNAAGKRVVVMSHTQTVIPRIALEGGLRCARSWCT